MCSRSRLRRGGTVPALCELRLDVLAAAGADPGLCVGHRLQCLFDQAARRQHVAGVAHPQLRPALDERDLADRTREPVVAHLAGNTRRLEHVAQVRDLDDRLGGVDLARIGPATGRIAG